MEVGKTAGQSSKNLLPNANPLRHRRAFLSNFDFGEMHAGLHQSTRLQALVHVLKDLVTSTLQACDFEIK